MDIKSSKIVIDEHYLPGVVKVWIPSTELRWNGNILEQQWYSNTNELKWEPIEEMRNV